MLKYSVMKRVLLSLLLVMTSFTVSHAQAQDVVYGNEWINYDQTYYKIKVVNTGLHRLSYGYLDSLGLRGVNPRHLQLFRRGKEVSIYVAGEADNRLDPQDYVEFFGERNDGALDQELYKDPSHQVHQLYSLYTDTAAYFLTVNPAGGKRMREVNPAIEGRTPEPYHLQKALGLYNNAYKTGKKYGVNRMPWMDQGEGFTSSSSRFERLYYIDKIMNVETSGPKPVLEYSVFATNPILHEFAVKLIPPSGASRVLDRFEINGDGHDYRTTVIEFSDISLQGRLTLQTSPDPYPTTENQISFVYGLLTFPQKAVFVSNSMFVYTDSTRGSNPFFRFSNAPVTTVAYDVTDQNSITRSVGYFADSKYGFVVDAKDGRSHKILLADAAKAFKPAPANKIRFRRVDPDAHNYIILTNKMMMKTSNEVAVPVPKAYAAYRASPVGGGYDTLLVYVDDLVEQFHYGEFSSNAIKRFVSYMAKSTKPKHMLILGKGAEYNSVNYRSAT
ncbi:MAG: C25 family cysteine peptidase, partial [Hymenobacteraceae bacterium]|nr:C25 family cysteine peptidase [Hymenobacteraceae bacterium]